MLDEPTADLILVAHQLRQLLCEIGTMRDDIRVLTAIAMRQNSTLMALLTEIRAMGARDV